jgi:hypothetical protein
MEFVRIPVLPHSEGADGIDRFEWDSSSCADGAAEFRLLMANVLVAESPYFRPGRTSFEPLLGHN